MTIDRTLKMKVSIRPLADRVVLRPVEETEQQRGGVLIPATAREQPQHGEVAIEVCVDCGTSQPVVRFRPVEEGE